MRAWDVEQVGMWCGWSRRFYGYEWARDVKDLPLIGTGCMRGGGWDCSLKGLSRWT